MNEITVFKQIKNITNKNKMLSVLDMHVFNMSNNHFKIRISGY